MIYKNKNYKISDEKHTIPIQLMTNKYDEVYDLFLKKLKEEYPTENYIVDLGVLIRYNRIAGVLLGISICFYFGNIEEKSLFKLEIESFDGFNISSEKLAQYSLFFENKLNKSNLKLSYRIKHLDER